MKFLYFRKLKQMKGDIFMYDSQKLLERIKSVAKEKGIRVKNVLSACDLNPNTLNQISDKKGLSSFSLAKIADYLECSVDYLLGRTEVPNILISVNSNQQNNVNGNNNISIGSPYECEQDELTMELLKSFKALTPIQKAKIIIMVDEIKNG